MHRHTEEEVDGFAALLMSEERRRWLDPEALIRQVGVKEGDTVVDLGCGPGFFTIPLARAVGRSGRVHAVDRSARMLDHLRSNLAPMGERGRVVEVIKADVLSTGIPDGCADLVLFANVLHDVDEKARFVSEVARIAKETGLVADVDWRAEESDIGPPVSIRLPERDAIELLEAELSLERRVRAGPHHYGLLFRLKRRGSLSSLHPR